MADAEKKSGKVKKTRKEREREKREFDRSLGLNKGTGAKLDVVVDRHMDDSR